MSAQGWTPGRWIDITLVTALVGATAAVVNYKNGLEGRLEKQDAVNKEQAAVNDDLRYALDSLTGRMNAILRNNEPASVSPRAAEAEVRGYIYLGRRSSLTHVWRCQNLQTPDHAALPGNMDLQVIRVGSEWLVQNCQTELRYLNLKEGPNPESPLVRELDEGARVRALAGPKHTKTLNSFEYYWLEVALVSR